MDAVCNCNKDKSGKMVQFVVSDDSGKQIKIVNSEQEARSIVRIAGGSYTRK